MSGDMVAGATRGRTPVAERCHRLHWFTGRTHELLDEMTGLSTWSLSEEERAETLAELIRSRDRQQALILSLIAEQPDGAAQLRAGTKLTAATARRLARDAEDLLHHPQVHEAMAAGDLHPDQAQVITAAVDKLPEEVAHLAAEAEEHLVQLATEHDAKTLKNLAGHLLEVIAPDQADELLAKQLAREEEEARRSCFVKTRVDADGNLRGTFKLPGLHGHLFRSYLSAVGNPQRPDAISREGRKQQEIDGQAFCELLERIPIEKLPQSGGSAVSVIVTMTLETLTGGLKAAGILGTDLQLSPGEARRLAAKYGVIPLVLGGKSEILDMGRKKRLFTRAQRVAMAIRQGGLCNIRGCDVPAVWCDANHRQEWASGGRTDLADGELDCPRHHAQIHQGRNYPRRT